MVPPNFECKFFNSNESEKDAENTNSIIYRLHNDNIRSQFNRYSFVENETIYSTWKQYYDFYFSKYC